MTERLIILLVSLLVRVVDYIKGFSTRILGTPKRPTCVVLYYHGVSEEHREKFSRQMDDVIRWAQPISIDNLDALSEAGHHVAITFDDGFQSVLDNALPELATRNIPITIYVPTAHLGQRPGWLTENHEDFGERVMTLDQARMLDGNLVSLGSHCQTHASLLSLSGAEAKKEVYQSREFLRDHLKREINTLSFPHGVYDQNHVQFARLAGYRRVFSISPSLADKEYVVGRVRVDPTDWRIEFILKLLGAYRWLPLAFSVKRSLNTLLSSISRI